MRHRSRPSVVNTVVAIPLLVDKCCRKWYDYRKWLARNGRLPKVAEKVKCTACGEMQVIQGLFLCNACGGDGKDSRKYREWNDARSGGGEPALGVDIASNSPAPDVSSPDEPFTREPVWQLVEGENCPACGKKVGRRTAKSGAASMEEEE